jgi:hypothetical protein
MCRATDGWYTTSNTSAKISDYQKTVLPTMTPEKKAIYEIFVLLDTHVRKQLISTSYGYYQKENM